MLDPSYIQVLFVICKFICYLQIDKMYVSYFCSVSLCWDQRHSSSWWRLSLKVTNKKALSTTEARLYPALCFCLLREQGTFATAVLKS